MKRNFTKWASGLLLWIGVLSAPALKAQGYSWMLSTNIYEVNTRIYTDSGDFEAFLTHIPRLREMNVDVLCFLPVHAIGAENRRGMMGDFYAISDHVSINPEFGTLADFKNVVKAAHEADMKVFIDWSGAYAAADHVWTKKNPTWFRKDAKGNFIHPGDRIDLVEFNYTNKELRKAMADAMVYWVKETGVDGFRCINTLLVPQDFWIEAREEMRKTAQVFMVADAESTTLVNRPFDMVYSRSFYNMLLALGNIEKKATYVRDFVGNQDTILPPFANRINYTSNYELNAFKGPEQDILGMNYMNYLVLAATLNGTPMITTGQELAGNRLYVAYEKNVVNWVPTAQSDKIRRLLELRHQEQALWSSIIANHPRFLETGKDAVLAYTRETAGLAVLVIINFSAHVEEITLDLDRGGRKIMEDGSMVFKTGKPTKVEPYSSIVVRLDAK